MGTLSDRLQQSVAALFPEVVLSPKAAFWPMPSLTTGELSSSAAIEIARATRQRAEAIADRIIQRLAVDVVAEWRNDRGYIVCTGASREVLFSEIFPNVASALKRLEPLDKVSARQVWCLVPDSTSPAYARIRLVARASLQALLTVVYEGRCLICLHPDSERVVSSIAGVVVVFRDAVARILAHQGEQRIDPVLPGVTPANSGPITVWTTHHYHERFPEEVRKRFSAARVNGGLSLIMPADGWLLSRDRALPDILLGESLQKITARLSSLDTWYLFMFHAAGTVDSGDFDPAVALFNECASPLWSLRALLDRYQRLLPAQPMPIEKSALEGQIDVIPEPRELTARPLFLPGYGARAIVAGEMEPWCEAVEKLAQRGHAFLNTPETRRCLELKVPLSNSGKIAAGIGFGLSCILPLVVEGACEDQ